MAEGNLDDLRSNFFINNVLEVMSLHKDNGNSDGRHVTCENCDGVKKAVKRCRVCCMFMCGFCTEAHRRSKATREHRLMTLEEVKAGGTRALAKRACCSKHKGEILKLFCQSPTCNRPVCRDCVLIDHRDHKYVFIDDIAEEEKCALRKLITDVKTKTPLFDEAVKEIERAEEEVSETVMRINNEIDVFIDGIIQMMDQKRSSLNNDVERIATAKTKQLKTAKDEVGMMLASMQSSVNFAEHALDNCEDVEILDMKKDVVERLAELKTKQCPSKITHALEVVFETKSHDLEASIINIATVSEKTENYPRVNLMPNPHAEHQEGLFGVTAAENVAYVTELLDLLPFDKYRKIEAASAEMYELNIVGKAPGVLRSQLGERCEFVLSLKNKFGALQDRGGDQILVIIQPPFALQGTSKVRLLYNNGSYNFSYTPLVVGNHIIDVRINGGELKRGGLRWQVVPRKSFIP